MLDQRQTAAKAFRDRLAPLLRLADDDPTLTEIFIDGEEIRLSWGDRKRKFGFGDFPGLSLASVQAAGAAAASFAGEEFGPLPPAKPKLSVKIPPDLRVSFAMPPIAEMWHATIRFLRSWRKTLDDYVADGIATAEQAARIRACLLDPARKRNILISGETGSGKTTLLRAMLAEVSALERIVVIEDTPELRIEGDNTVHLQASLNVDMSELLRHTLRLTPDRIVVGEVRGPEALELVRAMNTGHDGTLATIHSNGAEEALARLHTLVAEGQPTFPFAGVVSAVDMVLQLKGKGQDRRLTDIWEVPKRSKRSRAVPSHLLAGAGALRLGRVLDRR